MVIVRSILLLILIVCVSFAPPAMSARSATVTTLAFVEADLDQSHDRGQRLAGHSHDWGAADHSHAGGGAMAIVNTMVIVQAEFGLPQRSTALALAAFGGGSMLAALALPWLLEFISERTAMLD